MLVFFQQSYNLGLLLPHLRYTIKKDDIFLISKINLLCLLEVSSCEASNKQSIFGYYQSTSKTPFKWCFAGESKVALKMLTGTLVSKDNACFLDELRKMIIWPEIIKLFHAQVDWGWNFKYSWKLKCWKIKTFHAFKLSDAVFIMLISFMFSWVWKKL